MGSYTIVIEGHGINHNGTSKDGDEMAKALVAGLRAAGHDEVKGYFIYGPKLATGFIEPTMKRGTGWKMAEPLLPTCDQQIVVAVDKDGTKHWGRCKNVAAMGEVLAGELTAISCEEHGAAMREKHKTPHSQITFVDLSRQPVKA